MEKVFSLAVFLPNGIVQSYVVDQNCEWGKVSYIYISSNPLVVKVHCEQRTLFYAGTPFLAQEKVAADMLELLF